MTDLLFDLDRKKLVIAGAAGGIGAALAKALASRGCRLMLADIDQSRLRAMAADWPSAHGPQIRPLDVTDPSSAERLAEEAAGALGGIDGLLNATGIFRIGPALELEPADFSRTLEINVTGAFLLSRAFARRMQGGGSIVHLASVSSHVSNVNYAAYASSKAALSHLVRVLAREWAPSGIRVNAIGPALIDTPLVSGHLGELPFREAALAHIPMGRLATPDDLVGVAVLLLSEAGGFITGQTIYVDGGRTLA